MIVGMGGWKAADRREGSEIKHWIEIELTKMEKLSVALVFPLHTLSTWGEEGLTTIIHWWKMCPHISF